MTKRYLWTIVSAALCFGASPSGARAAAPDDWVCKNGKGECDPIVVRYSLPGNDTEVGHLVKGAGFSILDKGNKTYAIEFHSTEWLAPFLSATIEWIEGKDLLPDKLCRAKPIEEIVRKSALKQDPKLETPEYSYFVSSALPIHLTDQKPPQVQEHFWFIYPIEDTYQDGSHLYCLSFKRLDGGSHDGAVHGDS